MSTSKPTTIETYIASFPEETQKALKQIDEAIREVAPDAMRVIGYGIPTYKINNKAIVHFGGFKTHIGFYATPQGHEQFAEQLSKYKQGKGSVQFPLNEPMPIDLIQEIVIFRMKQVDES